MTSGALFVWVTLALALQVAVGVGVLWWRNREPSAGLAPVAASNSLFSQEVVPFALSLAGLVLATIIVDGLLHLFDRVWIGRYLGIVGTLLILTSFAYSLRKRKIITRGHPMTLLRLHERMAWAGALLVLVHAGIHFNGLLGWLAVGAMLINVASGLTGKFLLTRARKHLETSRHALQAEGLSEQDIEQRLHWDSLTLNMVRQWRVVHFPIAFVFAVLALAHILAVFIFWGWK